MCEESTLPGRQESKGEGSAGSRVFRPVAACLASSIPPHSPTYPSSPETEKLKFTPPPRPQQCMEFDKEATVPCSATGREKPTIKWIRAGGNCVGRGWGAGRIVHWSDVCVSEDQLSAQFHARNCGIDEKCRADL